MTTGVIIGSEIRPLLTLSGEVPRLHNWLLEKKERRIRQASEFRGGVSLCNLLSTQISS
jgi:hypothetical protein